MARMWANRLEAGSFSWDQCPDYRKPAVKAVLQEDVSTGRGGMNAQRYQEITGEIYPVKTKGGK